MNCESNEWLKKASDSLALTLSLSLCVGLVGDCLGSLNNGPCVKDFEDKKSERWIEAPII